jgi:hypothetical protein
MINPLVVAGGIAAALYAVLSKKTEATPEVVEHLTAQALPIAQQKIQKGFSVEEAAKAVADEVVSGYEEKAMPVKADNNLWTATKELRASGGSPQFYK